jgi:ABC-type transport system substrate-binding protein
VVGLGLSGCAGTTATPTAPPAAAAVATSAPAAAAPAPPTASAAQPKLGGAVHSIATSAARSLEPHLSSGLSSAGSVGPAICYSGLLTFKWGPDIQAPTYIPTGDLAESWTQPDDLTYLFKLRPGLKWQNVAPVNGRELVAQDIIFSYERIREKRTFAGLLASIGKMEAVDKTTLKLTLDKPDADFLDNMAQNTLLIVPRERVEMSGGNMDEPPVIGSGGFILEGFVPGERFTAQRNPDYYAKGRPYLDTFETVWVPGDPSLLVTALRAGTANAVASGLTMQMTEDLKKSMPTAVIQYPTSDRVSPRVILNTNLDMFKDVRVRQAISKAIDRKAINDTLWLGRAYYTPGLPLPDPSWSLPEAEVSRFVNRDVEGAQRLLSQAGLASLSFEILTNTALAGTYVTLAELVQANLREIGITTTIKTSDSPTWNAALQSGNFQAMTGVVAAGATNDVLGSQYRTGGNQNFVKYSDPELDKLIDQQAVMVKDPEGRKKILQDIQRKILNDVPYVVLFRYPIPYAHAPEIKGYYPQTGGGNHNLLWTTVWLDK